jgi:hypothetical protein
VCKVWFRWVEKCGFEEGTKQQTPSVKSAQNDKKDHKEQKF